MTESQRTRVNSAAKSGSAHMRPRARLISLIGEELISDEPVAVVELVKNSFDADANLVTIRFEGAEPDRPSRIVVDDDGHGMTLETVLGAWFEPGTVLKKRNERSPKLRPLLGAKGIGRFASARLGRTLLLETKSDASADAVIVVMEWGKFDDDSYLADILIEYESRSAPEMPAGTRLTIEGVGTGLWGRHAYTNLHSRLSRLISPFGEILDFRIELEIPGYPELSGQVQPPVLVQNPKYLFAGKVSDDGNISGTIIIHSIGGPKKTATVAVRKFPVGQVPTCGPFDFEIRVWDREREELEPIALRENQTVSQVRQTLGNYSGVSIYRDGFRVHPYGEPGDDWLRLDLRSRQNPTRNLANNQIIAAIRISRLANPELRDRSNREGMIENAEHNALREWFKAVLSELEEARYVVRADPIS